MIWLILVLALFLRLINLNQSLWWDEAINVVYAKSSSFWWFVMKYPIGDFHPPGWFATLWIWGHIFGFSEVAVRLPSVILGVATVWLTFFLGRELFDKKVGILAALLLAIAPLHVYYSQEARMYVFATFSVTLSFYFLNRLIRNIKWSGLGFMASTVLVLYSDYLAYFIIPTQLIFLIWVKKLDRKILFSFFVPMITLLPWLNIFFLQIQSGMNTAGILPIWSQVVGGGSLKDLLLIPIKIFFGRITFFDKTLYAIMAGFTGIVFGSIFILGINKLDQATRFLLSWIFIPLILAFLISFLIPVLSYSRMIFILPAVYLILAKGLENLPKKFALPALIFICLISISSLFRYYYNPKFHREDWREAVNFVSERIDNQSLVIFENNEIPAPARYYSNDLTNFKGGLSENLTNDLKDKSRVFLFEYLVDIYDPKRLVERKLEYLNFVETKTYDFRGVGFVKLYVK